MVDFRKSDWVVKGCHVWLLIEEIEYGVVDGAVVIEDFVEMCAKFRHVLFRIRCEIAILELHRHVDGRCVMGSFTTGEDVYVFPRCPWIHVHLVYFLT